MDHCYTGLEDMGGAEAKKNVNKAGGARAAHGRCFMKDNPLAKKAFKLRVSRRESINSTEYGVP
jgi:hypothetical protein